jgi:integrase
MLPLSDVSESASVVVKVKLQGLNVVNRRGRWYVYVRETGEKLLTGFVGSREDLQKRMAMPDFIASYNGRRARSVKQTWAEGTLGSLVEWFETECPKYQTLSDATKADYSKAFQYLRPEFDFPLADIDQAALYEIRDKCAIEKKGRFADKMIAAISSMFTQAAKRGKMRGNPALGIDKAHKADPNANREWMADELAAAIAEAPEHLRIVMLIARYAGFRGQTIATLQWRNYQDDARFGKCFRVVARKNSEMIWLPVEPVLQDALASINRTSMNIATKPDGTPWDGEVQMQTEVSHFLRRLEADGKIGSGTTLHGLRVTYAAALKRDGADDSQVAAALGDKSDRMGSHYTRHVENEAKVIRAFEGKKSK